MGLIRLTLAQPQWLVMLAGFVLAAVVMWAPLNVGDEE